MELSRSGRCCVDQSNPAASRNLAPSPQKQTGPDEAVVFGVPVGRTRVVGVNFKGYSRPAYTTVI